MSNVHEQRICVKDPAILARYLPPAVARYLHKPDGAPAPALDLDAQIVRLQELLQLVVSYVPDHIRLIQPAHPVSRIGHVSRLPGTLLSADLSGFTAFSTRLGALGNEGAELVARTVSDLFSALFGVLDGWNGNLLKLSGDALTALFSGADHQRRAVAAAGELQVHMGAFQGLTTPAGVFTLRMRIGVASGDVLLAEVGTPDRVELLVAGATARRAVAIQGQAPPGAVVVDEALQRALAPAHQAQPVGAGIYALPPIEAPPRPQPRPPIRWMRRHDPAWELHALIARIEAMRPYLVDQHLARLAARTPGLAGEGELRPVTVLFAQLSDAGPLLDDAAPSQHDTALSCVQASVKRIWELVARFGGTINKLDLHPDGHTLVALFGAPLAQGRDAEQAVGCALALLHKAGATGEPLAVRRIGIATGQVFAGGVGSRERREYTVMGSTVNLAARLMSVAGDRQTLVGAATADAAQRRFQLRALPPVSIKGYDAPISLYEVVAERPGRLSALLYAPEPLVGRQAELIEAQAHMARALAGHGAVVALAGEAGIGKSRLLGAIVHDALAAAPADTPAPATVVVQGHAHNHGRPYAVIAESLHQLCDLPEQPEQAVQAIGAYVSEHAPAYERFLPLLRALLGLPGPETPISLALTPEERRARLHEMLVALFIAHARARPTALVLEDLHWADDASLDVLGQLAIGCGALPLVLLCTYRPEGAPRWPEAAEVALIALEGLAGGQSCALFSQRLGGLSLPKEVYAAALERAQGNPFFIEETARALREHGFDAANTPPLPTSVQAALLARLDRLPSEERYILQVASVTGPLVSPALLADLTRGQVPVEQVLARLAARGLLRQVDADQYAFIHSLTQETAYESLLFAQRRNLHKRVADLLLAARPERADEQPGLLAFHYRRAEAWEQMLEWSWRAGVRAQALYAGDVALNHYKQALEAADQLDDAAAARRPPILQRCGDIHALAGRYPKAVAAFDAALAASQDAPTRAEILICWATVYEQQAAYDQALALLDQASAALETWPDELLALRICVRRGWVLVRHGAMEQARAAVEPSLERLEQRECWPDLLLAYKVFFHIALGQCRWSEARAYLRLALQNAERVGDMREIARVHNNIGVVLLNQGELHRAAESFERCARLMEEMGDRSGLALAKVNSGVIYYKIGDSATALDRYTTGLRMASEIGALHTESIARINLGEIYRQLGRFPDSLEQLLRSVELCQQLGDDQGRSEAYRQLAETYIALQRLGDAAAACEQALAAAAAAGDTQAEAIGHRVRGLLHAAGGDYQSALDELGQSIRLLTDLGSAHELGQSMVVQAKILACAGRADAARAFIEESIVLLRKAGAAADLAQAQQLLDTLAVWAPIEELWP